MNAITSLQKHRHTRDKLANAGWALLRGECGEAQQFDGLLECFLDKVTFDPARSSASQKTQKVDSGTGPIGLHIENGNTPLPPDIIAFHCLHASRMGSETTVCDGLELWGRLPTRLRAVFSKPITVRRTLPATIWKRYVATALGQVDHELITPQELHGFLKQIRGQSGVLNNDGSLDYSLALSAVREDNMSGAKAFANALMGPSFNYEKPTYCTIDGAQIGQDVIDELCELAEPLVHEISWQAGDVLLIDNKRVMHGRRAIVGPASERIINIGMGSKAWI